MAEQSTTKVITDVVRFSYCHVFKPQSVEEGGEKKYSVNVLIDKKNKALVKKIREAIEAAKEEGKAKTFAGKIPANCKVPLRDGDEERPEDETYAGMYFINATSKTKPGIIDRNKVEITDEDEFYSGCFGRISMNFYAFNTKGNKGIAAGLNNLQKVKDGERLSGRASAGADFGDDFELPEDDDDPLG